MKGVSLYVLSAVLILTGAVKTEVFDIAGLFTTDLSLDTNTRETYGVYPLEAAKMAVEHVTTQGFLAELNHELRLITVETSCDRAGAVIGTLEFNKVMGKRVRSSPIII